MQKPVLLISDLHLTAQDAATYAAFCAFLAGPARLASHLYILGDLFEYWIGDDDDEAFNRQVEQQLAALAHSGVQLGLLVGNRDFLLGDAFARRSQLTLLRDPSLVRHFDRQALLAHGDQYCTDDVAYQQFRQLVRNPSWQAAFLARPLAERRAEARTIRQRSEAAKQGKTMAIMDVNAAEVANALQQAGQSLLIHGHTHRPARHQLDAGERWVLPDWHDGSGGWLQWGAAGITLHTFRTLADIR